MNVEKANVYCGMYIPQAPYGPVHESNFIIGVSQNGGQRFSARGNLFKDGKGKPVLSQHYVVPRVFHFTLSFITCKIQCTPFLS